jgi:hypothetical protein
MTEDKELEALEPEREDETLEGVDIFEDAPDEDLVPQSWIENQDPEATDA